MEHEDIEIVACNDPFIEPHYAVSLTWSHQQTMLQLQEQSQGSRKLR